MAFRAGRPTTSGHVVDTIRGRGLDDDLACDRGGVLIELDRIVFVSVNKTFERDMTLAGVADCAHRAWPLSLAKAQECNVLVAVLHGSPIGAWRVLGAEATSETYDTNGGPRPRIAFDLGDPLPVLPEYTQHPATTNLRRGVTTAEWSWD